MRNATESPSLAMGADHIPRTPYRMEQRRREALVNLRAQPADLDIDDVGLRIKVKVPDRLEQHGAGDHLSLVPDQVLEQAELARLQRDRLAGALGLARPHIQLQVSDPQFRH